MSEDDRRSLWLDSTQTRFFLVPDDAELPEGDFVIRNLFTQRKSVDGAALASHEITREQAEERIRGKLSHVVDVLKQAFSGGAKPVAEDKAPGERAEHAVVSVVESPSATPREPADDPIRSGVEQLQKGVQEFLEGARKVLGGALAELGKAAASQHDAPPEETPAAPPKGGHGAN